MSYLLDTNVVCEPLRRSPDGAVVTWLAGQRGGPLFLSAITLAEIQFGIAVLDPGRRRTALEDWLSDLLSSLGDRLLPIDQQVATVWGGLRAKARAAGRQMPVMDAFVAATAEAHGLTLVTRNVRDFDFWTGPVFNPWDGSGRP